MDSNKPAEPNNLQTESNNNITILYVTLIIIVGLLLIWVFIVVFSQPQNLNVLNEMKNSASQIPPAIDELPVNINYLPVNNFDPVTNQDIIVPSAPEDGGWNFAPAGVDNNLPIQV